VKVPLSYSLRNLWARRLTTALTAGGMALVVFVFAAILMLAQGLRQTLVQTGSEDNVVVIRRAAGSEVQSVVERIQASIVETDPGIAVGTDGEPLAAKELVVLITLPKRGSNVRSNVTIRGVSGQSIRLRPQVKVVRGRMPKRGSAEIAVGKSMEKRFRDVGIGQSLRFGSRNWTIVGIFDAGNTGFCSEAWGDVDQLMQAFRRPVYSSVLFRLRNPGEFDAVKARLESDPRLTVDAKRETRYYEEQSEMLAKFLRILSISLTIVFSLGATIGAMITMYTAVASRIREIGTMRALGFSRASILVAFLLETLALGLFGGLVGLLFASLTQFITISTTNFQTFSELEFSFSLSPQIVASALAFSLIMGFVGGVLPAIRAARMNIVEALRES
jgi:putative ABC transport system permease protein